MRARWRAISPHHQDDDKHTCYIAPQSFDGAPHTQVSRETQRHSR